MDVIRSLTRQATIGYHLAEAEAWLAASGNGEYTTPLTYAAFELRLEIERIALELLARIQRLTSDDWNTLQSFTKIEARIYQLEGHQRHLDRKIELFNIMLEALQADWRLQPINLGRLRSAWHDCSQLCHITWSLVAATPDAAAVCRDKFRSLSEVQITIRSIIERGITWPRIEDPSFVELQELFINAQATKADILDWFAARGLWARMTRPDGTVEFVGVAIAPPAG